MYIPFPTIILWNSRETYIHERQLGYNTQAEMKTLYLSRDETEKMTNEWWIMAWNWLREHAMKWRIAVLRILRKHPM